MKMYFIYTYTACYMQGMHNVLMFKQYLVLEFWDELEGLAIININFICSSFRLPRQRGGRHLMVK